MGTPDVYAAVIRASRSRLASTPNYAETVLPMRDGLPKQKDLPEGTGRVWNDRGGIIAAPSKCELPGRVL